MLVNLAAANALVAAGAGQANKAHYSTFIQN